MDELLAQFLIEGPELVQQGGDALMALERRPGDRSLMDDAFRAIHTLKGSVGLFELPAMAMALHAAEDVLSAVRSGARGADPTTVDAVLAVLSQTERWLTALQTGGGLPDDAAEVGRRLAEQLNISVTAAPQAALDRVPPWAEALRGGHEGELTAIRYRPAEGSYFSGDDPLAIVRGVPGLLRLDLSVAADEGGGAYDPFLCRLVMEGLSSASLAEVRAALRFVPDQVEIFGLPASAATPTPSAAPTLEGQGVVRTLRIDADRIETLAALVDELVTAKTGLAALASLAVSGHDAQAISRALAVHAEAIDRLIGQTHKHVMALRMTPVGPLLRRFPRVVRELAKSLDKEIDLIVEDSGVQADKAIIEGLFEPLTHLLRNAVDHGVEAPAERIARGKPRKAEVRLSAVVGEGRFILTLQDDGAGIDPAAIRASALAKDLIDAERLAELNEQATIELILLPGFSTAAAVSDLSGRGVGMDAVKTAVQRMGGRLSVTSVLGQGTTVEIVLPLSLTLTKVLVVLSEGEAYGVPMDRVVETLRLPVDAITPIRAGLAFNWRDRTAPLLPLSDLVGGVRRAMNGDQKVLAIRTAAGVVGVAVDQIQDRVDAVVRPLDGLLAGMPGVSGTTLLGDGRVLMVLDPEALI
ncbi:MAG: hypothetical protein BGN86_14250 [Caulobacterales bacterium 68-7]|nr:MAG: hypothetical protein BGN86_14250 [Caulobacterales bacterium 68-7]